MTVVIWDSCDANLRFFITDKNIKHLHNKYVNNNDNTEELNAEICSLVYDENGAEIIEFLAEFPIEAIKNGANIIVCGFLP